MKASGSNYISTEWLTDLERRHGFFTDALNYRVLKEAVKGFQKPVYSIFEFG